MKKLEILYLTNRQEWRKWLQENFDKKSDIWLVYPKKASGKPRIEYNAAVEEALCFGWIDSTIKSLYTEHFIQRFSVRRAKSCYSQANKERLKYLLANKMIHPLIEKTAQSVISQKFEFPTDITDRIKQDNVVWENYQRFSESYKRIRIAYIDSARKRPEELEKRILNFINKTKNNKLIKGFGGINKYY